jgi:hypothetical protein
MEAKHERVSSVGVRFVGDQELELLAKFKAAIGTESFNSVVKKLITQYLATQKPQ